VRDRSESEHKFHTIEVIVASVPARRAVLQYSHSETDRCARYWRSIRSSNEWLLYAT